MTEESGGMVKITVSGRDEQAHRDFGMWPMIVVIEVVIGKQLSRFIKQELVNVDRCTESGGKVNCTLNARLSTGVDRRLN